MPRSRQKSAAPKRSVRPPKKLAGRKNQESFLPQIPHDELSGENPNHTLAADIIELHALLAKSGQASLSLLAEDAEIGGDEYRDLDDLLTNRERVASDAASEISSRERSLGEAYPFVLSANGRQLSLKQECNWGRVIYLVSLLLSHLPSSSPVLVGTSILPTDADVVLLRRWFQYCATATVAAEIGGRGWAFGWPRPDKSRFIDKLAEIWGLLNDGSLRDRTRIDKLLKQKKGRDDQDVKDDEIDIIAARPHGDQLPGFPLILAQVASGANWRAKSLRNHVQNAFFQSWFDDVPASQYLVYHIVPYCVGNDDIVHHTRLFGHILSRLRLSIRARDAERAFDAEARSLVEGVSAFSDAAKWLASYSQKKFVS